MPKDPLIIWQLKFILSLLAKDVLLLMYTYVCDLKQAICPAF